MGRTKLIGRCAVAMAAAVMSVAMIGFGSVPSSLAQSQKGLQAEVEQLRKRVDQLEGQLVDLQVIIGTLESLARNPGSGPAANALSSGADSARVAALETQISALSAQVARLAAAGNASPSGSPLPNAPPANAPPLAPPTSFAPSNSFGSTTVTESFTSPESARTDDAQPPQSLDEPRVASSDPGTNLPSTARDPKADYERAYGYLLQQNYDAARTGFVAFLKDHPRHTLAGNAQYWLGEVYFVRGNYKAAAQAFLRGYQTYGRSSKAPDSLLKLAVSLDRLGERKAACQSFSELVTRFPRAPGYVKDRAKQERRRLGC